MTEEQKAKCRAIAAHYGIANQRYKAVEEMAELIQAIMKPETAGIDFSAFEHLLEELADAIIMIEQLRFYYDSIGVLDAKINEKLDRQLERMERESNG